METQFVASQEAGERPTGHMRPGLREEPSEKEANTELAYRKFLSLYDSLQWHMYI
jgi:hypothetical protein